jgi:hypothetical protein
MTCATINKEIKKQGINGKIVRGKGYYYFIGDLFDKVPSIYSNDLRGWTVEQIIDHIKESLK